MGDIRVELDVVAGAGAPRGLLGGRPPSGGGGGRGAASAARGPRGQATSSSVADLRSTAGSRPGPSERHRCSCPAPPAGSCRSETRGRIVPHRVPGGPGVHLRRIREAGPATPHTSAPPWRVRALHKGESAVGRGENRRASKSVGGRACAVGGEPGGGRGRPASCGRARGPRRRSRSPGEEGDRSRRARGWAEDGVQRLAAVVAQQHSVRRGACAYLGGGEQVLKGTSSRRSPGTWLVAPAREIREPD